MLYYNFFQECLKPPTLENTLEKKSVQSFHLLCENVILMEKHFHGTHFLDTTHILFKENFHGKGERQVISNSGRRCQVTAIRGDKWNAIGVRQLRESDENTLLHPKICRWLSETNMWRSAIGM